MQIFTKQATRWAERECEKVECRTFRAAVADTDLSALNAHDSYLINLASPDKALRARSLESFICELRRCAALGLGALVSHPGNFMDDRASGLARNADAITEALIAVPGRVRVLLETTAGSGTALGASFEELAEIIERVPKRVRRRVGVCIDTAHIFAAGYDIARHYDDVMTRFGDVVGFDRLGAMHLNDSKAPLGSRRDRHELDRRRRHRRNRISAHHDGPEIGGSPQGHRDAEAGRPREDRSSNARSSSSLREGLSCATSRQRLITYGR